MPLLLALDIASVSRGLAISVAVVLLCEIPVLLVLRATTGKPAQLVAPANESPAMPQEADSWSPAPAGTRMRTAATFGSGTVVGILIAGLFAFAPSALDWTAPPSEPDVGPHANIQSPTSADPSLEERRTARCRSVLEAQARPLRTAAASLDQWQTHVAAMNQLVAGEITLEEARAFWNRTRLGAQQRLSRYESATKSFHRTSTTCSSRQVPEPSAGLESCVRVVKDRNRELAAADVALGTWRSHVADMEMFRKGLMTPEQATSMWLRNWRRGVAELKEYRAAARQARGQRCSA
ncbi:hypothetical protein [Nocardioides koreensis]|uniref:hypothetical protein n=1 Tax=Nocardioides koreensis TaxID=433651 RepID=UPI0031CDCAB7